MGFTDNFTKPPYHSPQKRTQSTSSVQSTSLQALMLATPTRACTCSFIGSVESRSLAIKGAVPSLDLDVPETQQSSMSDSSQGCNVQTSLTPELSGDTGLVGSIEADKELGSSPSEISEATNAGEEIDTTESPPEEGRVPVDCFDSPIRKVARDISWGNMEEIFSSPPKEYTIVPKHKLSQRSPSKKSIIVNEDPVAVAKRKSKSKKSSSASVAVPSPQREYYVSPMRLVSDRLSLRSLCLSGDKDDETMAKFPSGKTRQKGSSKSGRSPKPFLKRAASMHGGFKPRLHFDDDSTSESTTMDKSVHSLMSFSRPRSPRKLPAHSAFARKRR